VGTSRRITRPDGRAARGPGRERRTSRCSSQGGHYGFPRLNVFPARPAAEQGRYAAGNAAAALSEALSGDHVIIPAVDEDPPSNVSSAGQADIQLWVKPDLVQPNGIWIWAAADNLRISALTAVECAETMMATRPTGKIQ